MFLGWGGVVEIENSLLWGEEFSYLGEEFTPSLNVIISLGGEFPTLEFWALFSLVCTSGYFKFDLLID